MREVSAATDPVAASSPARRTERAREAATPASSATADAEVPAPFRAEFLAALRRSGLYAALALLNGRTRYRFTGIYRVDPPLLRNLRLYDRENPSLELGGDISTLDETYCHIVYHTEDCFATDDAARDERLRTHPARASVLCYLGAPVHDPAGRTWGTLCHFDVRPRLDPPRELPVLAWAAAAIGAWLWEREES